MSVFRRIKTIVDSNINSFLDKAEDPEKLNRLMIAEMEEAAVRAENEVKKLEGELEENGKRIEEAEKAISRWQKRAEMAIDKGQDDMAKEAIRARKASEDIYGILKAEEESLSARCKELSEEKEEMEKKIQEAKERVISMPRKEKKEKTKEEKPKKAAPGPKARFEEMERRIDRLEGYRKLREEKEEAKKEEKSVEERMEDMEIEEEIRRIKTEKGMAV